MFYFVIQKKMEHCPFKFTLTSLVLCKNTAAERVPGELMEDITIC